MSDQIENKRVTKIEERAAIEIDRPEPIQASQSTSTETQTTPSKAGKSGSN
jgi:hypothetical protein